MMQGTEIRYIHLRRKQLTSRKGEIFISYSATGGITVAYTKIGANQYKCAFTRCNQRDHYSKSKGRNRAKERLLADDDIWMLDTEDGISAYVAIVNLARQVKEFKRSMRPEIRT